MRTPATTTTRWAAGLRRFPTTNRITSSAPTSRRMLRTPCTVWSATGHARFDRSLHRRPKSHRHSSPASTSSGRSWPHRAASPLHSSASAPRPPLRPSPSRPARAGSPDNRLSEMTMYFRTLFRAFAVLTAALLLASAAAAQTGTSLTGRLTNSLSGDPVGGSDRDHRRAPAGDTGRRRRHLPVRQRPTGRVSPVDPRRRLHCTSHRSARGVDNDGRGHPGRPRDPLRRSGVGQPRAAQSGRVLSADNGAGRAGADQATR